MGNDSCEHADSCGVPERALCACGVLWAADIGMGMLLKDTYVRPATCGFQHLREPGCALAHALWGSSCKLPKSSVTASSGRLEMPCECASRPHIHARACTWHAIVQTEVRTVLALALGSALGLRHLRGFDLAGLGLADRCHHRWRVGCALSAFELKRPSDRFTRDVYKRPKTSQNVPKRPKTSQNVPKRPKSSQIIPKRPNVRNRLGDGTDAHANRSRVVAAARSSQNDTRWFRRGESAAGPPHSDGNRAAPKGHGS